MLHGFLRTHIRERERERVNNARFFKIFATGAIYFAVVFLFAHSASAATRTISNAGGNWDSTGTWAEGVVPTSADDVVATGTSGNVTINVAASARSVDLTGYVGTLTHNSGITLSIGDATAGAGNVALKFVAGMTYTLGSVTTSAISFISTSATQQTITTGGKTLGNWTINGAGSSYLLSDSNTVGSTSTVTLTAGTLNTNGETVSWGTLSSSNSNTRTLTLGASVVTINGTGTAWDITTTTGLTFGANTSEVIFNNNSSIAHGSSYTLGFNKITVNSGYTLTMATGFSINGGILTLNANSVLTGSGKTLTIWSGTSVTPLVLDSTADMSGINNIQFWETTVSGITLPAFQNYPSIKLTESNDNIFTWLGGNVKINGYLTINENGTNARNGLDLKGYSLEVTGNLNIGSGSSVGMLQNSGSQTTLTVGGNIAINLPAHSYNNEIDSTNILISVAGNFTNNGTFTHGSSTLTLNGTSDQTITTNSQAFYNLTPNNTGASGSDDIIISGALDVNGLLTITDGDLDVSTNDSNVNIANGMTVGANGSIDLSAYAGTWTYDGTGTLTDNRSTIGNLGTFTIDGTAATLTLGSNIKATSTTIAADDTLNLGVGSYTLELIGAGTPLTINGTFNKGTGSTVKYSGTSATNITTVAYNNLQLSGATTYSLTNNLTGGNAMTGSLTIDTGATLDATLANNYNLSAVNVIINGTYTARGSTITASGNWDSLLGTFTYGTSTVNLTGVNKSIAGTSSFYNLTKSTTTADTLTFPASATTTVSGTLTLNGDSGQLLSLRSSVSGTPWGLNLPGSMSGSYLDVKDSNASYGGVASSTASVDSGNNTNWRLIDSFVVDAPGSANVGEAFSSTITAKDAANNTTNSVSGSTALSVSPGVLDTTTLAASQFTDDGIWTGNLITTDSEGQTVVLTATNGTVTGSDSISVPVIRPAPSGNYNSTFSPVAEVPELIIEEVSEVITPPISDSILLLPIAEVTESVVEQISEIPSKIVEIFKPKLSEIFEPKPPKIEISKTIKPILTTEEIKEIVATITVLSKPQNIVLKKIEKQTSYQIAKTTRQIKEKFGAVSQSIKDFGEILKETPSNFKNLIADFSREPIILVKDLTQIVKEGTVELGRGGAGLVRDIAKLSVSQVKNIGGKIAKIGKRAEQIVVSKPKPSVAPVSPAPEAEKLVLKSAYGDILLPQKETAAVSLAGVSIKSFVKAKSKEIKSITTEIYLQKMAARDFEVIKKSSRRVFWIPEVQAEEFLEFEGERAKFGEYSYKKSQEGIWVTEMVSPAFAGEYELKTIIEYQNGESKEISDLLLVKARGWVYKFHSEGQIRLKDAKVELYYFNPQKQTFELWPAGIYGQRNPQTTDSGGEYAFLLPRGRYYLGASKDGYLPFESEEFEVKEPNVLNQPIELGEI